MWPVPWGDKRSNSAPTPQKAQRRRRITSSVSCVRLMIRMIRKIRDLTQISIRISMSFDTFDISDKWIDLSLFPSLSLSIYIYMYIYVIYIYICINPCIYIVIYKCPKRKQFYVYIYIYIYICIGSFIFQGDRRHGVMEEQRSAAASEGTAAPPNRVKRIVHSFDDPNDSKGSRPYSDFH